MSRHGLYTYLFFLLPMTYFFSIPICVGDFAIWIAHGKHFFDTGSILYRDTFSILPTGDLIYPVLSSLLYGGAYKLGGLVGASYVHRLAALAIIYFWYRSSIANLKSPWTLTNVAIVLFAWFGSSVLCIDRPALLAMTLFLPAFLILNRQEDLQWREIILLNAINVLWVNIHGSWIVLLAIYLYRETTRNFLIKAPLRLQTVAGPASVLLTSILNPFGYSVFRYAFETARVSKLRNITEWAPTDMSVNATQAITFYVLSLGFLFYYLKLRKTQPERVRILLCSPFIFLLMIGFQSIRHTIWVFFSLIPIAYDSGLISDGPPDLSSSSKLKLSINLSVVTIITGITILLLPPSKPLVFGFLPKNKATVFDSSAPFLFAEYLESTLDKAPVFNDWEYGSFLALAQSHPIFIDIRNIIYRQNDFEKYLQVVYAQPGWEEILSEFKIKYIILNKSLRETLISKLAASQTWERVLENGDTVLFRGE